MMISVAMPPASRSRSEGENRYDFVDAASVAQQSLGVGASAEKPHLSAAFLRAVTSTCCERGGRRPRAVGERARPCAHHFYLAVADGTNRLSGIAVAGIGVAHIERMNRIFYRAFSYFMGPFSKFSNARAATLQAAAESYGAASNERAQLQQAWTAVGVN